MKKSAIWTPFKNNILRFMFLGHRRHTGGRCGRITYSLALKLGRIVNKPPLNHTLEDGGPLLKVVEVLSRSAL